MNFDDLRQIIWMMESMSFEQSMFMCNIALCTFSMAKM
jgi:hypothetical protein